MQEEVFSPGLEGIIAGETAISTVGGGRGLRYRGYSITDLVEHASFDEVAFLLLHGELPTQAELEEYQHRVKQAQVIAEPLRILLKTIPKDTPPMDMLRTGVSVLAHFDPDAQDNSHEANVRKAERLLGQIPVVIAEFSRYSNGLEAITPKAEFSHAANFLYMLTGEDPKPDAVHAFDVSLTLYAEHEFNASTFTSRVVCSTESDMHSAVVAAIGALKGRLHGGANEKVVELLQQVGGPELAEQWIRDALARKERVMGFGHRVYKSGDIRAKILKDYARKAAESVGQTKWEETADIIEKVMIDEKKLMPNLDWPAGRLYYALGLDVPLYTPFFVAARAAGWCAHVIEQSRHNRLIRPRAKYVGPEDREVKPIGERE
ncbi:MAG: citrate/2-methylcitrate synthase [Gemmataceae bacterium]